MMKVVFIGYNHHKDMVIFDVALLFDEMSANFQWLFGMFNKCMGGGGGGGSQQVSSQTKQQRLQPRLEPYIPSQ
ncbi:hypothetical protein LINPERPRIM_LOCUS6642 [Linum perenne]